jgi:hypothetical protein
MLDQSEPRGGTHMSLCAREKAAFRRHLDVAVSQSRADRGMSVVEVAMAVAVLLIVLLPTAVLVNNGILTTNGQRLRVEADNLATANLEKVQQEAASGPLSGGTTTFTYQSRAGSQLTVFKVVTQFTPLSQSGGSSNYTTVCQNGGSTQLQIWSVTATVTWTSMHGEVPVSETTDVAPGQAGAADLADGEIAIPVKDVSGNPIAAAINYYATPNGTGAAAWLSAWLTSNGDASTLPGIPGNTGTTGCGVVTGLPVAATGTYPSIPQWTWTVQLSGNTGYVATTEQSDANPAGPPLSGPITLHPGQISYALNRYNQQFQMAIGVQTSVTLQTLKQTGGTCEPVGGTWATGTPVTTPPASCDNNLVAPLSDLPITVANPGVGPTGQYTFGSNSLNTTQMLLYPFTSGYSIWSGDMVESNPGDAPSGTPIYAPDSAVTLPITLLSTTASVIVPVYPLNLTVTLGSATPTATEIDGAAYVYTLNPVSGGTSATGIPLGQYQINAPSMVGSLFVWITPTGTCQSASQLTVCSSITTPVITVTE